MMDDERYTLSTLFGGERPRAQARYLRVPRAMGCGSPPGPRASLRSGHRALVRVLLSEQNAALHGCRAPQE